MRHRSGMKTTRFLKDAESANGSGPRKQLILLVVGSRYHTPPREGVETTQRKAEAETPRGGCLTQKRPASPSIDQHTPRYLMFLLSSCTPTARQPFSLSPPLSSFCTAAHANSLAQTSETEQPPRLARAQPTKAQTFPPQHSGSGP